MFIAQSLYNFSKEILKAQQAKQKEQEHVQQLGENEEKVGYKQQREFKKRNRDQQHDRQLKRQGNDKDQSDQQQEDEIIYLSFKKGDKILVEQAFQNGWWFGYIIKNPQEKGFFPSNYVQAGAKPPPPSAPKSQKQNQSDNEAQIYDPDEGKNWIAQKFEEIEGDGQKPITSDYYQGITSYKYVKINDKNKNILNGNYVKFDVNTGLARVPVKDQAPGAKAVRQMGYYFDFHQWNEQRNKNPESFKAKADKSKKKKKKLRLLGFNNQP